VFACCWCAAGWLLALWVLLLLLCCARHRHRHTVPMGTPTISSPRARKQREQGMESETVPSRELAPPILKSEAGEEITCLEQGQAVTSEASTLEQGQGLARFTAKGLAFLHL